MVKYKCPECAAVLSRAEPLAPGKKIKCPKCATVFQPPESRAKREEEALPIALVEDDGPKQDLRTVKAIPDEDDDRDPYKVMEEIDTGEEKEEVDYGSLRASFAISKRGPAMALTVEAANFLVGSGIVIGVVSIIGVFASIFPFIYSDRTMSGGEVRTQIFQGLGWALGFGYGVMVVVGGSKMHSLESYTWAWIGAVLGIMPFLFGIFGIVILTDPIVKDGFEETRTNPDFKRQRST